MVLVRQYYQASLVTLSILAVWFGLGTGLAAQEIRAGFSQRLYQDQSGEHRYALFLPQNYDPNRKWPVILFLHGAGECGTDGQRQLTVGLGPYIEKQSATFPFIAVFPQCEDTKGRILTRWRPDQPDGARALKILAQVEANYSIDPSRRLLIGWSMGGFGAWAQGAANPRHWAAVVPLAGGGDVNEVARLKDTPVWAFHGAKDLAVRVDESRKMIAALRAAGGQPFYTEIEDLDHDTYKAAFDRPEFYQWLLNPKASGEPPLVVKPGTKYWSPERDLPFVPALFIRDAAFVRLGNEALHDISDAIPHLVPAEMMTGRIQDLQETISAEGRSFGVVFSGITYSGKLFRAQVKSYSSNRVNVQLGLSNLQLLINSTTVNSGRLGAWTGPISIVIGHNEPVWLTFDVQPYCDRGQVRLRYLPDQTRFEIPTGNWYVTNPAGVSTRGWGMTAEKVTAGLVRGLYGSKSRIEDQVRSVVPRIVTQLEQKISLTGGDEILSTIWPIPIFKPRVKVWAQEISTDEKGISLVLGASAAALVARPRVEPRWVNPHQVRLASLPKSSQLTVGIAPGAIKPIAELLMEDQIARVNVLDTPVDSLRNLANPKFLSQIIPDIKRFGDQVEVWTEIVLTEPVDINELDDKINVSVPGLMVSIAIKPDPSADEWQPYAEIRFDVQQPAEPRLVKPSVSTRAIELLWDQRPQLKTTARFAPQLKPVDATIEAQKIEDIFIAGWSEWTQAGANNKVVVPDLDFGYTRLRLQTVSWSHPHLMVTFDKPGVVLSNRTRDPLVFQTRGPYSAWSHTYTLKPGETNQFRIAYPLGIRRTTNAGLVEELQLPAGSFSELRTPPGGGFAKFYPISDSPDASGESDTAPPPPTEARRTQR